LKINENLSQEEIPQPILIEDDLKKGVLNFMWREKKMGVVFY
jgi:hypothetical protein